MAFGHSGQLSARARVKAAAVPACSAVEAARVNKDCDMFMYVQHLFVLRCDARHAAIISKWLFCSAVLI